MKNWKKWTQQEIDFLKQNYGRIPIIKISRGLIKTEKAIYCEANRIGLKSNLGGFRRKHTEEEKRKIGLANKGRKHTKETKRKISLAHIGKRVKPFSEKGKKNMKIARKKMWENNGYRNKMSEIHKKLWQNPNFILNSKEMKRKLSLIGKNRWRTNKEYREKVIKNSFKNLKLKPNKPERQMMQIIKLNNLPFNYVGNGKVYFKGFNPDFLSKNPKHIIEVFGDYWHRKEVYGKRDKRRTSAYTSLGYKTLVIWEHELKEPQKVVEKIINFIKE